MIAKRIVEKDETGTLIECIIDSSNVLKTQYFAHNNRLYVYFNRGHAYSYENVTEEIYKEFEDSDSQGEYLRRKIMKDMRSFPYRKEFKLSASELKEAKQTLNEWKDNQ